MNEEALRKSLTDAGVAADKIDGIVAAGKVDAPTTEPKADDTVAVVDLQKSLDDLKATLEAGTKGPSEAEVQETIKKAIDGATSTYEKFTKEMAATTDLLIKSIKDDSGELRKAVTALTDVVGKLAAGYESVKKALDDTAGNVKAASEKDFSSQVTEAVQKALDAAAPLRGKSVQPGDVEIVPHPGDNQKPESIKKSLDELTEEEVIKAIGKHPDARTRSAALMDLHTAGKLPNPSVVLAKYGIAR